ncbi:MAG TPA: malectin, partial [Roseiflexaceae bacterium]|nr:malectin [Roseiflexaceae bacterium]
NFVLRSAHAEVSPASLTFVVSPDSQRSATLTLHNSGTFDLTWEMLEVGGSRSQQAQQQPARLQRLSKPTWGAAPQMQHAARMLARPNAAPANDVVIDDPSGDAAGSVDITTVRSGSDGASATIALDFSATTPMDQVGGYLFIDIDQDSSTGMPATFFYGLPTQDLGAEYYVSLFGFQGPEASVAIISAFTGEIAAIVPASLEGQTVSFEVPYAALADDGLMNIGLVVGDLIQPTDWAPDIGYGTLTPFVDVSWLSAAPSSGVVAPDASQNIAVTIDTTGLEPGIYTAALVLASNSPREPVLYVPVQLVVPAYQQAVNVGGSAYTDAQGLVWAADQSYTAGSWGYMSAVRTARTTSPIGGTEDDALYQTARRGLTEYRFDGLPAGTYEVELDFAEILGKPRDKRMFDVIVEGALVLPAHDIAAEVGGLTADTHTFFVVVNDGQLSVRFVTRKGFDVPLINAVRVTHRPDF